MQLSDSKLQNIATNTFHIYTVLARMFEKKQMTRGETMWDQTYGCAKKYMCYIAYYLMSLISKSYQIVLDRAVDKLVQGKRYSRWI